MKRYCLWINLSAAVLGLWAGSALAKGGASYTEGFEDFCRRYPSECAREGGGPGPVRWSDARVAELQAVNQSVNASIKETSDESQYGQEDVWDLPTNGLGDCEDYALLKRKMLLDRGWPSSALQLMAGTTGEGVPHVVLVAVTDGGEYVLDSRTASLKAPAQTGYQFLARQSAKNPKAWVTLTTGSVNRGPVADLPVSR